MPKSRMRRASMTMCSIRKSGSGRFAFPGVQGESCGERFYLAAHARDDVLASDIGEHGRDQLADLAHFLFFKPSSGHCRGTQPDTARVQWLIGVERNGVLVDRNTGTVQRLLRFLSADLFRKNVQQHHMRVRAARYHAETFFDQG